MYLNKGAYTKTTESKEKRKNIVQTIVGKFWDYLFLCRSRFVNWIIFLLAAGKKTTGYKSKGTTILRQISETLATLENYSEKKKKKERPLVIGFAHFCSYIYCYYTQVKRLLQRDGLWKWANFCGEREDNLRFIEWCFALCYYMHHWVAGRCARQGRLDLFWDFLYCLCWRWLWWVCWHLRAFLFISFFFGIFLLLCLCVWCGRFYVWLWGWLALKICVYFPEFSLQIFVFVGLIFLMIERGVNVLVYGFWVHFLFLMVKVGRGKGLK